MAGRRRDSNPFDDDEVNPFAVFRNFLFLKHLFIFFVLFFPNLYLLSQIYEMCLWLR